MRVLVTGSSGVIGSAVARSRTEAGDTVVPFDVATGGDLRDAAAVRRAAAGCEAIVHLGAIANDANGTPEDIMATNVLGTFHVLRAAELGGAARVVYFSSAQVFGTAEGERLPDFFPISDEHPRRATRPYGISKCLSEDLCHKFSERTGVPTVALRPVGVFEPGRYERIARRWALDPSSEWSPFWEFGAFVDLRDVVTAVTAALTAEVPTHVRATLCADDIAASGPSLEMAARLAPTVRVVDEKRYADAPWAALVDSSVANEVLGWRPRHRFPRS